MSNSAVVKQLCCCCRNKQPKTTCCWCALAARYIVYPGLKYSCALSSWALCAACVTYGSVEDVLRLYCDHYGRPLVSTVARAEHVTTAQRERYRSTGQPPSPHSSADETPVTFRAASREKAPCSRRGCLHLTARRNGGQNTVKSAGTHPKPSQEDLDAV